MRIKFGHRGYNLRKAGKFRFIGEKLGRIIYDDKGVLSRRIVRKFDGRKMMEAINYDGAGKMWLPIADVYDDKGLLKEPAGSKR